MKTAIFVVVALSITACGGPDISAAAGPHDSFDGVWRVTSAAGQPAQQFNFFRDSVGNLQLGGWVFYPTDPDHISYVGAESLSGSGATVTGTVVMTANTVAFTVPISVTFDSAAHFTGTLGSVQLDGSR